MALNKNNAALSPQTDSPSIGVIFPKGLTIDAAEYGLTLKQIAAVQGISTPFATEELFAAIMLVPAVFGVHTVTVEFKDGGSAVFTFPAWAWIPVTGTRILASTSSAVSVLAGQ